MAKNHDNVVIRRNTKINPDKKEVVYWRERAEREFLAGEQQALQVAKDLKENYRKCINEIEKEINAFYGKYASDNKISLEEAKKLLNREELKSFKQNIKDILNLGKKENFSEQQLHKFKIQYAKTKISRLTELQTNIEWELDRLTKLTEQQIEKFLNTTYENQYYESVFDSEQFKGYFSSFSGLDKERISKAVRTKWLGENYSTNIWKNEAKLINNLSQEIPRGLTLGYNPKKLTRDIVSKRIDKQGYNNTVRLLRTEYSKIQNEANIAGYKAAGIKQYQILATLDSRTSDICRTMNDEIYNINQYEIGVTAPPFHPNCRTTTIAYFPKDEIDEMSEEELKNIGFITYDDWKNGLVKLQNGKVIYKRR